MHSLNYKAATSPVLLHKLMKSVFRRNQCEVDLLFTSSFRRSSLQKKILLIMGNKNNNSHIQEEPIVVKGICMNFLENLCQDSGLMAVHWVVFRKLTRAKTQETSSLAKINSPYYLAEFLPLAWQDKCPVLCLLTYPSIYFCGVGNITQGLHLQTKISTTAVRHTPPKFILCTCVHTHMSPYLCVCWCLVGLHLSVCVC